MGPNNDLRVKPAGAATLVLGLAVGTMASASVATAATEGLPQSPSLLPPVVEAPLPVHYRTTHTSLGLRRLDMNVLDGHVASVRGSLRPGLSKRVVVLQVSRKHRWLTVARARTGSHGRFTLRYEPRETTSERIRVRFYGDAADTGARRPAGRLNVYRLAMASWYGGGGGLACGGTLTSSTLGVANKTLPCGTLVTLRYHGHTVRVPVIDRGPYVAGREFDLTEATKRALGFGDLGEVWATS